MADIHPLGDRLMVLPLLPQDKTKGGIIFPDSARERPSEGIVLAVGRGKVHELTGTITPMEPAVGDVVQFGRHAGVHCHHEALDLDVLLMRDEEVLGRKLQAELPDPIPGDPRAIEVPPSVLVADYSAR